MYENVMLLQSAVFFSPETLQLPAWRKVISSETFKDRLVLVAIDEAHCVSEWGKDFRTDFEKIGGIRALTSVPFMALTASAPPNVRATIVSSLQLNNPVYVNGNLDRPNIYMSANAIKGVNRDLNGVIEALKSSSPESVPKTIVFTQTKNIACKIVNILQRTAAKKNYVNVYHASLTQHTKSTIQSVFSSASSNLRCLVATIAFGMGMDIPDVEVVFVYGVPKTASQLYQLFGRAGRNGCPSRGHLFYSDKQRKKKCIGDTTLSQFVVSRENCKRRTLICGMGGTDCVRPMERCCDVCTPQAIMSYDRLNVLEIGKAIRMKKRVVVRVISEELSRNLNFVHRQSTDISLFGVRSDLKDRFFNVISSDGLS